MKTESLVVLLMGRGLASDLAQRIAVHFPSWEVLSEASAKSISELFSLEEVEEIRRAKNRREIPRQTVDRLIRECEFRCCLCWNIDSDTGVIIHHIRPHASVPDDRYENLVVLCADHHDKVHTKRELTRHPFPPELLIRRKEDFVAAISAFKAGKRVAPGRETNIGTGMLFSPPLPPLHFVGRDVLERNIADALLTRNCRAAIVGMGGVGKTALAFKVTDSFRDRFSGGILWTEIGLGFTGISGPLRAWIKSLGHDVPDMGIDELLALCGSLLRKRAADAGRLLLLIDDINEHVIGDFIKLAAHVTQDVSILITTRDVSISAALGAVQFQVDPLSRADCRQILESISGSTLVRTEKGAVDTLLSLLGDLPLAVELMARQIAIREYKPGFSIAQLCKRLEEFDPQLLSFPGHRGISMSFALSYESMDDGEQRIFRSLGIFASTSLRAKSVAAVNAVNEEELASRLDRLVIISALNWGNGVGDYRIHPLLHKYAAFLFNGLDITEQNLFRQRYYQYYTATAIEVAQKTPNDLQAIDQIFPNLTKAIEYAYASADHSVVCETVLGLCAEMGFFTARNLERESLALLNLALSAAKNLKDRDAESAGCGYLGTSYARLGMITEAMAHYEHAATIAMETSNDYNLASHLQNFGTTLLSESKDLPRAEKLLHEALKAAERSQNVDAVIGCLSSLGSLHRAVGNLKESARLYKGALDAARLYGNRVSEGNNLSNLGLVTNESGDVSTGEKMISEALAIAVETGDRRGEGNRTGHLGGILFAKANQMPPGLEQAAMLKHAHMHTMTALNIARETGDTQKAACWLMNLGNITMREGNQTNAMEYYQEALEATQTSGYAFLEAQARFNLGIALVYQGQLKQARDHFHISRDLLQKMGSPLVAKVESYIIQVNRLL